jgi:hypothetical protein
LEALALMKSLGGLVVTLLSIAKWFSVRSSGSFLPNEFLRVLGWSQGHAEFTHVSDAAADTLRFVRTFATIILRSTPHLYLSALPFAPRQSRMFRRFTTKFPYTPRIVAGHVKNWPQMEKIIHADDEVNSVAMSPDANSVSAGCGLTALFPRFIV